MYFSTDTWLSDPNDWEETGLTSAGLRTDIRVGAEQGAMIYKVRPFCRDACTADYSVSPKAFTTSHLPIFDQPLVTFCPAMMTRWVYYRNAGFSIQSLLDVDVDTVQFPNPPTRNSLNAVGGRSFTKTLIHEMFHINQVVYPGTADTVTIGKYIFTIFYLYLRAF